ncbi:sacsin N-terminal ATP-binding-like domain-containing protein [Clostridium sp.]|uniref:sacsin N-terminal ATP-binding-like domain-containing protein n=1 Tax=Clostridium sp. TaxID=1506 RepID=UPI002FDCCC7D
MGKIDYKAIREYNKKMYLGFILEPEKHEALLAGHYSESNHFIYELLQNAEDAGATKVIFEYYEDKLIFYHDGKPFDQADVKGVASLLMGTKNRESAQTIGKFGMGFKSVYKYTRQPIIYSDDEAFRIGNYLLPIELEEKWNWHKEKSMLSYTLNSGDVVIPFDGSKHLTKFIIPFSKKSDKGRPIKVQGKEVLQKLESLDLEILLFLSHIKRLFWIDKESGKHAMITIEGNKQDKNLKTCRIEGTAYGKGEKIANYLKFTKKFNHPEMTNAEVSIAYRINNRSNNINEMSGTNIWVYFPTKDTTELPFLIHGSFETAVSREKLMAPSEFNSDMFDKMGDLICESFLELRERKLITQMFLRKVIIAAFKDEAENHTIPGLREKITKVFLNENLLPDKNGNYKHTDELSIAVPFGIADFFDKPIFEESFRGIKGFVTFNNVRESNFTDYYMWLKDDLHLNLFNLESWANMLSNMRTQSVNTEKSEFKDLKEFYTFVSDNRESIYNTNLRYTRSGSYERIIRDCLGEAWKYLRHAPIILNANDELVPAYHKDLPNIYLNSSSEYKSVIASAIVNAKIAREFMPVLTDGFNVSEFNNYQYVKEKVIKKYTKIENTVDFDNPDDYKEEYIEDIRQILKLINDTHDANQIANLVNDAYIIRVMTDDGLEEFCRPSQVYVDISEEGIDMTIYYAHIPKNDIDEEFDVYHLDTEFYNSHGISIKKLEQLGLITTPVVEGIRHGRGQGYGYCWTALGEYCPKIDIDGLKTNLTYIENNSDDELARKKSAEILKLMLAISEKLSGTIRCRKTDPYEEFEESSVLSSIKSYEWLYNKDGETCSTVGMSKYDLNTGIYGELIRNKEAYKRLGFIETQADNCADTFDMVYSLNKKDKSILLKQLARELGMQVTDPDKCEDELPEDEEEGVFDPNSLISTDFPTREVRNLDNLIEHVRQQFFCADPITYKKVLRQIRVSKNPKTVRAYAIGMYTNDGNIKICQMCKHPADQAEVTAIANYGIELEQLNLCLCPNCAAKYKMMRDANREKFKNDMKQAIKNLDIDEESSEYKIELNSDNSLYFTQIHIAEIQAIFDLLDEYGLPNDEKEHERKEFSDTLNNSNIHSRRDLLYDEDEVMIEGKDNERIHAIMDGNFVVYKKIGTGECKETTVNSKVYPLQKVFVGKNKGDIVSLNNQKYEIINIL